MYDYEQMRAYNMPTSEDGIYATPVQEPRAPMDICDKLIVAVAVAGFVAIIGGATYLAVTGPKYLKEQHEQQRGKYQHVEQESEFKRKIDAAARLEYDILKKEILRGR